jgi:hypothetical protein
LICARRPGLVFNEKSPPGLAGRPPVRGPLTNVDDKTPKAIPIIYGLAAASLLAAFGAGPAAAMLRASEAGEAATSFVAPEVEGVSIDIPSLAFSVAQLECFRGNELIARATGFFWAAGDDIYLVTSRHVVLDEDAGHRPNRLKLRLHTDPTDIRKNGVYVVPLYGRGGAPRWLEHPEHGAAVDVVAIPLSASRLRSEFVVTPFGAENRVPDEAVIQVGEDVVVIGYPLGLYDVEYNLPLVGRGTLASFYPIPFEGHPYFLIECRLHAGCSGSPVLTKPGGVMQTRGATLDLYLNTGIYLLGVNSSRVGKDAQRGDEEPLGLNAVWFTYLIGEIISREGGD